MIQSKKIISLLFSFIFYSCTIQSMSAREDVLQEERLVDHIVNEKFNESITRSNVIIKLVDLLPTMPIPKSKTINLNKPEDIIAQLQALEPYERLAFCLRLNPNQISATATFTNELLKKPTPTSEVDHDLPDLIEDNSEAIVEKIYDLLKTKTYSNSATSSNGAA